MGAMTASTEPAGLPPGPLTGADLAGMPDVGHRYELLDGVLVVTPAPGRSHQIAAFELDGDGTYQRVAEATGEELLVVARPFPFEVRPADLLRRACPSG